MMFPKFLIAASILCNILVCIVSPVAAQQPLRKVTINWGFPQFLIYTAPILSTPKMMKYWEEEGLDVTVIGSPSGSAALQALIGNQVQMTFTGASNVMQFRQQGVPIKAIANVYNNAIYFPAVKADGPIQSIKDLKGKTVGVCALAASCEYWLNAILKEEGVDPKDVARVVPGLGAAAWHALNTGQVAALVWSGAGLTQMETVGANLRRFDKLPYLKDLTFVMTLIAHESMIKSEPKVLIGLARGIAKATAFAKANPEAAVRMHWQMFPITKPASLSDEQAMAAALRELRDQLSNMADPDRRDFGAVSNKEIDAVAALMLQNGVIKQQFPADNYFTDEFVKEVNNFDLAAVREQAKNWKPN
jgi:NitT/TauT family transport system substrate-binding protein